VIDLAGIEVAGKVGSGFETVANLTDEGLFEEPILVAAVLPAREVRSAKGFAS